MSNIKDWVNINGANNGSSNTGWNSAPGWMGAALGGASTLARALTSGQYNYNDYLDKIIYGDPNKDPLMRLGEDLFGNAAGEAAENLARQGRATNFDTTSTNNLMNSFNNATFMREKDTTPGLGWKSAVGLAMGAPWLDYQGDQVKFDADNLLASAKGAINGLGVGGAWGALIGGAVGGLANIGSRLTRNSKIKKINKGIQQYNQNQIDNFNAATNLNRNMNNLNALANYSAFGGPLSKGITSNSQYANKHQPAVMYAEGGNLHTHGADFSNGMHYVNAGRSHEENPHEGVQFGVDPQGIPNLVEEGEVIFNEYVFSNRLKVPEDTKEILKLRGKKKTTFADAAKKLAKESEERPNDPISRRGLEALMDRLAAVQEEERFKDQMKDPEFLQKAMSAVQQQDAQEQMMQEQAAQEQSMQKQAVQEQMMQQQAMQQQPSPEEMAMMQQMQGEGMPFALGGRVANKYSKGWEWIKTHMLGVRKPLKDGEKPEYQLTWQRGMKPLGAALGTLHTLVSPTDYSNSDILGKFASNLQDISAKPIGNYMTYRPVDRQLMINQLNANNAATRRSIMDLAGGNVNAAKAMLLANDYNHNVALGKAFTDAEQANWNRRKEVETFNADINKYNSTLAMQADQANTARAQLRLEALGKRAAMRQALDDARMTAISNGLTNVFDSWGNIGTENFNYNQILDTPANAGYYVNPGMGGISRVQNSNSGSNNSEAKGGMLTIKKRKRRG